MQQETKDTKGLFFFMEADTRKSAHLKQDQTGAKHDRVRFTPANVFFGRRAERCDVFGLLRGAKMFFFLSCFRPCVRKSFFHIEPGAIEQKLNSRGCKGYNVIAPLSTERAHHTHATWCGIRINQGGVGDEIYTMEITNHALQNHGT